MTRIYHTSDLHDHRHIVAPLARLRAERPGLLVDCGDSLRGSQTVYYANEPIIPTLDAAGYDLQAIGNREFHYLFPLVGRRIAKMRHPVLCANLVDVRGRPLPFAPDRTIAGDDGAVRFFGLLVPQYPEGAAWERWLGWRFRDPYAVAADIAAATPDGTTLIALSHLGLRADRELARRVPRLDLILGGHSHDTLATPEYVGDVPIVHAGPYGAFASRTELERRDGRARIADFALEPLR
jgi:5'-nucleotidase